MCVVVYLLRTQKSAEKFSVFRPLLNNNEKWPSSAYFGKRERRRQICRIFIRNPTNVAGIS